MGSLYKKDVIHTAHCYKGYEEEPEHPNWTIFAQRLDAVHYFNTDKQSVEWCLTYAIYCLFVNCEGDSEDYDDMDRKWDCLNFTYEPSKDNCACAAWAAAGYFKAAGEWYDTPEVGDFIFFKNKKYATDYNPEGIYHGGLVIGVDDGRVYTSEGNKNTGGSPGIVGEYDYSLNYNAIAGYGRPHYDGWEREESHDQEPEPVIIEPAPVPQPDPSDDPEGTYYTVSVNSWLNVRNGPGTEYPVVDKLYNGETVVVYEERNGWGRISQEMYIWVCMKYLELTYS